MAIKSEILIVDGLLKVSATPGNANYYLLAKL